MKTLMNIPGRWLRVSLEVAAFVGRRHGRPAHVLKAGRQGACPSRAGRSCHFGFSRIGMLIMGLAFCSGLVGEARAQATAVSAIPFNGSGHVNTTWLGNVAASGTYTFVYQASGTNTWAISSQAGTLPAGFISPLPANSFGTATTLVILNGRYYIRSTTAYGSCAGWGWGDSIYTGPLTNQVPVVSQFSLSPASVPRGALATVNGNVSDADGNLTAVRLDHLPPGATTWITGTAGAGTAWAGAGTTAQSLNKVFLLPTAGTWTFRLSGTDSGAASSGFTSGTINVANTPYYDPSNFHNGVVPIVVVTQGNGLFGVAGQFNTQATVIRVQTLAGVALANAPVQVNVTSGGGGLAATAAGGGVATLNLTTNASGLAQFFYRQSTTPYAVSALQVVSGRGLATVTSYSYTAADAALDADGDGLSGATEAILGTPAQTANVLEADPIALGLLVHAPQR